MYKFPYNSNYVIDDLLKLQCMHCRKYFLASSYDVEQHEKKKEKMNCPFCGAGNPEAVVSLVDPDILAEMGCAAIGRCIKEGGGE